jgi:outer membrane protein
MPQPPRLMRLFGLFLFCALVSLRSSAQTNTPDTRKLSLEDCIETALKHNLDIQVKRYNPEIAAYNLGSLYGSYEPSLYIDGEHDYNQQPGGVDAQGRTFNGTRVESDVFSGGFSGVLPWGTVYNLGITLNDQNTATPPIFGSPASVITNTFFDLIQQTNVSFVTTNAATGSSGGSSDIFSGRAGILQLRQPLLKNFWIDNTRLQIFIDKKNLKISELDVRSQVMSTVTAVEEAYYNLIYDQENIKVQQKAVELNERQLVENQKRVEVGAMAPLDEKQAQSQVASSQADLLAAIGTEETQQRVLKTLLSDNYTDWKQVVIEPTFALVAVPEKFDLQESWRRGLADRPDLLQQKLSLEKQGYIIKYQRNQLFPQLDLVGTAGYNAAASGLSGYLNQLGNRDNPFYSVGGQFTVPLTQTSARNSYKAAKAGREQIALSLKQLEQNVMIQIENAIAVAHTSYQRVLATREARVYAEAALDAERKKLESGKSTSFVVLQLTRDLTTARSAEIRALADYNIAVAEIALNEGSTLERRHVTVQWK